MASVNPFRYRGYYYDTETGFYYLQSRYYGSAIGRFINADNISTIYVGSEDGELVHNSCNHNSKWDAERRKFWRETAKTVTEDGNYGAYIADKYNIDRMRLGKAPIGYDGKSVQLHHWYGIANDFYAYSPISFTYHKYIHKFGIRI